ncbi:MAG TPA: NAD(P)H-binding protein [Thermoanaerobaculia bacterium]
MPRALLLGATGLVGRELLTLLLADSRYASVVVVARRRTGVKHAKLIEHVFDLEHMEAHREAFIADDVFCALGTTIKIAGSQERFRAIDLEMPLRAARLARAQGASHYLLVSSVGANAKSRIFYTRVKGELEHDLAQLGYPSLTIARPATLLGPRTEHRSGEGLAQRLGWLVPAAYKPIEGRSVARALVAAAHEPRPGVRVLPSREMRERYG